MESNPSNGQASIDPSSSQSGGQEINQGVPYISEAQKPLYSKDDLEQVLAEALRLAIDIVRAKKAYTPAGGQSSYYQNSYANKQNNERPGPNVQYQSYQSAGLYGAPRAPPGYYR